MLQNEVVQIDIIFLFSSTVDILYDCASTIGVNIGQ